VNRAGNTEHVKQVFDVVFFSKESRCGELVYEFGCALCINNSTRKRDDIAYQIFVWKLENIMSMFMLWYVWKYEDRSQLQRNRMRGGEEERKRE